MNLHNPIAFAFSETMRDWWNEHRRACREGAPHRLAWGVAAEMLWEYLHARHSHRAIDRHWRELRDIETRIEEAAYWVAMGKEA